MSDAMKNGLKTAGALALIVGFMLLMFYFYRKGEDGMNNSMGQYDEVMGQYGDVTISMFRDNTVSGSQVIELIQNLDAEKSYSVVVINGANQASASSTGTTYTYGSATFATDLVNMSDKSNATTYINPYATFKSVVTMDKNGTVTAITLTQLGV